MARAEIGFLEASQGDLPHICLCCGKPATVFKTKKLSTLPFGIPFLLLPGLIVWGGKISIQAPLCTVHRNYFLNRTLLRVCGCLPMFVLLVAAANASQQAIVLAGWGIVVAALAYGILVLLLHYRGLRVLRYNRERMVVAGLAAEFVEAIESKHRSQKDLLERLSETQSAASVERSRPGASYTRSEDTIVNFTSSLRSASAPPPPVDESQRIRPSQRS